jgi:ribonuclease HI
MLADNAIFRNTIAMELDVYTDGGARGNPGPGAIGIVVFDQQKPEKPIQEISQFIGENVTNNHAEYQAVLAAIEMLTSYQPTRVRFFLDSELVVKQLRGEYKIKQPHLQTLAEQIRSLSHTIPMLEFNYVPREKNKLADVLVNQALDTYKLKSNGIT